MVGSICSHLLKNLRSSVFSSIHGTIVLPSSCTSCMVCFLSKIKHTFSLVEASIKAIAVISASAAWILCGVSAPNISISISRYTILWYSGMLSVSEYKSRSKASSLSMSFSSMDVSFQSYLPEIGEHLSPNRVKCSPYSSSLYTVGRYWNLCICFLSSLRK